MLQPFQKFFCGRFICRSALYTIDGSGMLQKNKKIFCALRNIFVILNVYRSENKLIHRGDIMTLTIPISRFRRLLFAVLQAKAVRVLRRQHTHSFRSYMIDGVLLCFVRLMRTYTTKAMQRTYCRTPFCSICALLRNWNHRRTKRRGCCGLPST